MELTVGRRIRNRSGTIESEYAGHTMISTFERDTESFKGHDETVVTDLTMTACADVISWEDLFRI